MTDRITQEQISIVFAGGGCRTFWSLGVLEENSFILSHVKEYAGVSAGSAMALATCLGMIRETIEYFMKITEANRRNFYIGNIFGRKPVFPHEAMYRAAVVNMLENTGMDVLRHSPPVRFLLACFSENASISRTVLRALKEYRKRKKRNIVHGPDTPPSGLEWKITTAQDAGTIQEVCDLVLASSSTPPITGKHVINGLTFADGGLVDNVPVRALSEAGRAGKVLVLLTRPIPEDLLPVIPNRLYFAPGNAVPVSKWDYTSPEKLEETFLQGRKEGIELRKKIEKFLK